MQRPSNVDEPGLLFRQLLENTTSRLQIKTEDPNKPRLAVDYKMIDGGTLAYLSRHLQGEREKNLRIVDCTKVPAKHLD